DKPHTRSGIGAGTTRRAAPCDLELCSLFAGDFPAPAWTSVDRNRLARTTSRFGFADVHKTTGFGPTVRFETLQVSPGVSKRFPPIGHRFERRWSSISSVGLADFEP